LYKPQHAPQDLPESGWHKTMMSEDVDMRRLIEGLTLQVKNKNVKHASRMKNRKRLTHEIH